jgi:hypothetical protein
MVALELLRYAARVGQRCLKAFMFYGVCHSDYSTSRLFERHRLLVFSKYACLPKAHSISTER